MWHCKSSLRTLRTRHNEIAVARGLQHTARAITSAAAIMVVVFLAFAFTSMLAVQETGFALAAAVFVDATIIRVLLVPAAMRLMGHWNWWFPGFLDRILPRIDLSEGGSGTLMENTPAPQKIGDTPVSSTYGNKTGNP